MIVTISKSFLILLFSLLCFLADAQLPISFSQNLGDTNKNIIQDVIDLDGDGCLTIGYTKNEAANNVDLWVNRVDNNGTLLWTNNFGGTCFESANAAALLDDGNIVVVGQGSFSGNQTAGINKRFDGAILKIDIDGNLVWQRTFGGSGQDQFNAVVALPNGQCVAVGSSTSFTGITDDRASDGWAVRINTNGASIWDQTFGGELMDRYTEVILTDGGELLLGGDSNSSDGDISNAFGKDDIWVSSLTLSGAHNWSRKFGGTDNDRLNAIAKSPDGGFVLAGTSYSTLPGTKGHGDVLITKINATGTQLWQQDLGGTSTDKATDITNIDGDAFLLSATSFSNDGDISNFISEQDAWIAKLDASGDIQWQQTLGGAKNDAINAISISDDGLIWLAGYSFSSDGDLPANLGSQDGWLVLSSMDTSAPTVDLGDDLDICIGTDITLDATDANCPSCTYLWNDNTTDPIKNITVSSNTSFSVTITNSFGLTDTDIIEINAVPIINATAELNNPSCTNNNDGSIVLTVTGGTGNYDFEWSNTAANTPNNTGLSPGTYLVTISDEALCEFTESYTLTQSNNINISADITEPTCNSTGEGQISIEVSGGEEPYDILWSDGTVGPLITGLNPGEYMVTVTDNQGCVSTETYFVSNDIGINVQETIEDVSCFGLSDGSVSLSVSGDFPPFSFMWDNGFASNSIVGLSAGDYKVSIMDAMGCVLINQFSITEPNEIEVFEQQTNTQSGQESGRLLLNISGGTPSYDVRWSNGASGVLIENLAAGIYTATITDSNGCTLVASYEIEIGTSTSQFIEQPLTVYPNPSNGVFTVEVPDLLSENFSIIMTSLDGKQTSLGIHNQTLTQLTAIASQAAPGLYILTLQDEQYIYQSKLIIQP